MALALNDVLRVVANWNWDTNSKAQMVWHYKITAGAGAEEGAFLGAVDTALDTAWANIAGRLSTDLIGTLLEMFKWDFVNHQWDGVATHVPTGIDGTDVGDHASHGVAALAKILTVLNRRQGRKFVPGLVEDSVTDGLLIGAALVNLADFASAFDVSVINAGTTGTFCTFNTDPLSSLYETASTASQSIIAEATTAYQRRRRPGVGLT